MIEFPAVPVLPPTRDTIVVRLRAAPWVRGRLHNWSLKKTVGPADFQTAFDAYADAGEWNRRHPANPITAADI